MLDVNGRYQPDPPYPFVDTDFLPPECFEFFPLAWRWTHEKAALLPADDLARIRPFMEWRAREIALYGRHYFAASTAGNRFAVPEDLFSNIVSCDGSDLDAEPVRAWLCAQGVAAETKIVVAWDRKTVVLTEWGLFCRFWDDFCYPMSEDVVIWPESEAWALAWWHEEWFSFGTRTETMAEPAGHGGVNDAK